MAALPLQSSRIYTQFYHVQLSYIFFLQFLIKQNFKVKLFFVFCFPFSVLCNNLSDCGFSPIKLIWNRSRHMFGTEKCKMKTKMKMKSRHESCYNITGKRQKKTARKTIHTEDCLADNPSTLARTLSKSRFFSKNA